MLNEELLKEILLDLVTILQKINEELIKIEEAIRDTAPIRKQTIILEDKNEDD